MTSKTNQGHQSINFTDLEAAEPFNLETEFLVSDEEVRAYSFDEAVEYLNNMTALGRLLPLAQMNLVLKKFQSARYGLIDDATRLYHFICQMLHSALIPTSEEFNTHYEMMEIYVRRLNVDASMEEKERIFAILDQIFTEHPSPATLNSLMNFHKKIENWQSIHDLFNAYSKYHSDHIYELYLDVLKETHGLSEALNFYSCIFKEKKIKGNRPHIKIIQLHLDDVDTAEMLFFQALSYDQKLFQDEYIHRALLKALIKHRPLEESYQFFQGIPAPNEATYSAIIKAFYQHQNDEIVLELYQDALSKGLFHKNSLEPKLVDEHWHYKVDLHSRFVMGGGATIDDTALSHAVIHAVLLNLLQQLEQSTSSNETSVEIVCGQGTFATRTWVQQWFKDRDIPVAIHPFNPGVLTFAHMNFKNYQSPLEEDSSVDSDDSSVFTEDPLDLLDDSDDMARFIKKMLHFSNEGSYTTYTQSQQFMSPPKSPPELSLGELLLKANASIDVAQRQVILTYTKRELAEQLQRQLLENGFDDIKEIHSNNSNNNTESNGSIILTADEYNFLMFNPNAFQKLCDEMTSSPLKRPFG